MAQVLSPPSWDSQCPALWPGPAWSPWKLHFLASGHGMVMCECERGAGPPGLARQPGSHTDKHSMERNDFKTLVLEGRIGSSFLSRCFIYPDLTDSLLLCQAPACVLCAACDVLAWLSVSRRYERLGCESGRGGGEGGGGDLWGAGDMWRDSGHRQPRSAQCQSGLATDSTLLSQLPASSLVTCPPEWPCTSNPSSAVTTPQHPSLHTQVGEESIYRLLAFKTLLSL